MSAGATGATRRCALPADGGCGRVLPAERFQRYRHGEPWGYFTKCEGCRCPYPADVLAEGRRLYESGAPMKAVADALGRAREDAVYRAATAYRWDREARERARQAGDGRTCCRPSCSRPRAPGLDRCRTHEAKRLTNRAHHERQRTAARAPLAYQCTSTGCYRRRVEGSDYCEGHTRQRRRLAEQSADRLRVAPVAYRATGSVTIRCHVCGLHRVTALAAPVPCPRCGTSGAAPVGVWDEEAAA